MIESDVPDEFYLASGNLESLKRHKLRQKEQGRGFGYRVVNEAGAEHPIASAVLATGGSGKERNLIYQPKAGVAGKQIKGRHTPLNDEGIRYMTPKEWGRLQGFIGYAFVDETGKDRFRFPENLSKAQKYKQLGNSVTIPVIEEIARMMHGYLTAFDRQLMS